MASSSFYKSGSSSSKRSPYRTRSPLHQGPSNANEFISLFSRADRKALTELDRLQLLIVVSDPKFLMRLADSAAEAGQTMPEILAYIERKVTKLCHRYVTEPVLSILKIKFIHSLQTYEDVARLLTKVDLETPCPIGFEFARNLILNREFCARTGISSQAISNLCKVFEYRLGLNLPVNLEEKDFVETPPRPQAERSQQSTNVTNFFASRLPKENERRVEHSRPHKSSHHRVTKSAD